jgi:hypothetical protein
MMAHQTSPLPTPAPPDVRVHLPHVTCEALVGLPEAAILFAAGRDQAARACLEQSLSLAPSEPRAWAMLFELHHALDDRCSFDSLAVRHAGMRPGIPVPPWGSPPSRVHAGMIRMSGVLKDEAVISELLTQGKTRRVVALDFAEVTRIDYELAPRLCGALRLLNMQSKRVILANLGELQLELLALMGLPAQVSLIARRRGDAETPAPEKDHSLQAA